MNMLLVGPSPCSAGRRTSIAIRTRLISSVKMGPGSTLFLPWSSKKIVLFCWPTMPKYDSLKRLGLSQDRIRKTAYLHTFATISTTNRSRVEPNTETPSEVSGRIAIRGTTHCKPPVRCSTRWTCWICSCTGCGGIYEAKRRLISEGIRRWQGRDPAGAGHAAGALRGGHRGAGASRPGAPGAAAGAGQRRASQRRRAAGKPGRAGRHLPGSPRAGPQRPARRGAADPQGPPAHAVPPTELLPGGLQGRRRTGSRSGGVRPSRSHQRHKRTPPGEARPRLC
jgi:hypothetical protein